LLAQAVQEKKAQETGEPLVSALPSLVTIDLPLPAYIPSEYVPDTTLRLRLYRRLAQLTTLDEIDAIAEEMADRFGPIPDEVDNLLYQLRLKVLAGAAGVEAIAVEAGKLAIRCSRLEKANRPGLQRRLGRGVRVSRRAVWVPYADVPQQTWRVLLVQALEALSEL
jgi:transcription-repair coupling factor (superfamily II helicase)